MSRAHRTLVAALAGAVVLGLASLPAGAGGGWVPVRGASYLELSVLHATTTSTHDATGARVPFRRVSDVARPTTYRDAALAFYGEVGLGRGFALEADAAWKRIAVEEPASRFVARGPADVGFRLKRGFRAGPLAWAVSSGIRVPLAEDDGDYPSLGSGAFDAAAMLHAGLGLPRGWAQAEAGVRTRGGPAADEWPFALQAGLHAAPRVDVVFDLRGHGRLGSADVAAEDADFDPARASSSVLSAGPGVAFAPARGLRLSAQAWRTLSGRNMPAGWTWKLGLARVR